MEWKRRTNGKKKWATKTQFNYCTSSRVGLLQERGDATRPLVGVKFDPVQTLAPPTRCTV